MSTIVSSLESASRGLLACTVDSDPSYKSLAALPVSPTIVNIVVPPESTLQVLQGALRLGLHNVWVQPGAESPEVMTFLNENEFNYLANSCIMVRSRLRAGNVNYKGNPSIDSSVAGSGRVKEIK